uniref:Aldose 1-epimerase n=1 Tax=Hordeum vulgare subsp. vulgare TaxID=112509 RepID=A0A8I6XLM2_HORVV
MARALVFLVLLCLVASALVCGGEARKMVGVYVLKKGDFSVKVTNWGATIMSIILPDGKGNLADVVLGKDTLAEYVNDTAYFGPLSGRVAQRMARGRFVLDGKVYHTYINDGRNAIHGGHRGFSKVIWTVKEYVAGGDSPYITLYYRSFDGEQGFPGDLDVYATYQVSSPYALSILTNATDAPALGVPVMGGKGVRGYDINYVIDGDGMRKVAAVRDGASGRALQLWANQPAMQLYTGNGLNGTKGKGGVVYRQYGGFCLETQAYPDAVNHPEFPSVTVRPGQVYKHDMLLKFSF